MKDWLSGKEQEQFAELVKACNDADGTHYSVPADADEFLLSYHGKELISALCVYRLGETRKSMPVEELVLLTHPDFRGCGRAGKLLKKYRACGQASGQSVIERYGAYPCEVSEAFLQHMGAVHDYDECVLEKMLAGPDTGSKINGKVDIISSENEDGTLDLEVKSAYSQCGVRITGSTGFLHSVRTDAGQLRKGSASAMLEALFEKLAEEYGLEKVQLCVSSNNRAACGLYLKLGFTDAERLQIWYSE